MGMDIDYIAARESIKELEKLLFDTEHGEREEISNDIITFVEKMKHNIRKKKEVEHLNSLKNTWD